MNEGLTNLQDVNTTSAGLPRSGCRRQRHERRDTDSPTPQREQRSPHHPHERGPQPAGRQHNLRRATSHRSGYHGHALETRTVSAIQGAAQDLRTFIAPLADSARATREAAAMLAGEVERLGSSHSRAQDEMVSANSRIAAAIEKLDGALNRQEGTLQGQVSELSAARDARRTHAAVSLCSSRSLWIGTDRGLGCQPASSSASARTQSRGGSSADLLLVLFIVGLGLAIAYTPPPPPPKVAPIVGMETDPAPDSRHGRRCCYLHRKGPDEGGGPCRLQGCRQGAPRP